MDLFGKFKMFWAFDMSNLEPLLCSKLPNMKYFETSLFKSISCCIRLVNKIQSVSPISEGVAEFNIICKVEMTNMKSYMITSSGYKLFTSRDFVKSKF